MMLNISLPTVAQKPSVWLRVTYLHITKYLRALKGLVELRPKLILFDPPNKRYTLSIQRLRKTKYLLLTCMQYLHMQIATSIPSILSRMFV